MTIDYICIIFKILMGIEFCVFPNYNSNWSISPWPHWKFPGLFVIWLKCENSLTFYKIPCLFSDLEKNNFSPTFSWPVWTLPYQPQTYSPPSPTPTKLNLTPNAHCSDVIMSLMASQITSLTIVYSTVYSGADHRKHQRSVSLAFVRGIHRWPVNSPHKGPVTRKMFPFDDVIMH